MEQQTNTNTGKKRVTAEQAKEMLSGRERSLQAIDRKMALLYKELGQLENSDMLLGAVALPAKPAGMGMPRSGGSSADNTDVLLRYYRQKRERQEEIRMQMWKLSEEAEDIRRLWNCFLALREPYYSILHELYVKKELYAAVQCSSGFSHRIFEEKRKEGLCLMADMFSSGYSTLELMEKALWREEKEGGGRKRKAHGGIPGQMELPLDRLSG